MFGPIRTRGFVLLALLLFGLLSASYLGLSFDSLVSRDGGFDVALRFLSRAVNPAMDYESLSVPASAPTFFLEVLRATGNTLLYAAAAMAFSILIGMVFGFLSSTAWWADETARGKLSRIKRYVIQPALYFFARTLLTLMRSIHEVFWALLFSAAFGLKPATAVLAIAIPFGGTLGKIFSEMIDEAPRDSANALRSLGASPLQIFSFGLLPRALPDLVAYTFYRCECALRAAAILGFFGIETLGAFIKQSMASTQYGEVWTYLYALFVLVLIADLWSSGVRRRLIG